MPGFEVIDNRELDEIKKIFDSGGILFKHGFESLRNNCFKVNEFENSFAKYMGARHALAVSSGTAALRVALAALNIKEGDEVITQSFTFVATVEAIIEARATPICANIDKTLNICPEDLRRKISSKTKAVIAVHMLGSPAKLKEISDICKENNIYLIEDTAWGCGGKLESKFLGTWGDIGTFSFDFAKTMTTGEGGMLICNDENIYQKASAWHDHGHENNPSVPRWEDTRSGSGFNFRMMEIQGALGIVQLSKLDEVIKAQRKNKKNIWSKIRNITGIEEREIPNNAYETADALVFLVENKKIAKECREALLKNKFSTKILPEAYSWHFAGTWDHMGTLVEANGPSLMDTLSTSNDLLSRAVSLPISIRDNQYDSKKIASILSDTIKK